MAKNIAQMDVIDPLTLKITLRAKNAVFPGAVTLISFIPSPTAVQAKGSSFGNDPVGAGPFMLKSWVRDSAKTFVRNPNYWNAHRPYADQFVVKVISNTTTQRDTFLSESGGNMMFVNSAANVEPARAL